MPDHPIPSPGGPTSNIRVAEIVAALSIATDLGMGRPPEFALRSCILSLRLGEALGMSEEALGEVYYQALLRFIGCNVETRQLSAVVGDEAEFRAGFARIVNGSITEILQFFYHFISQANQGASRMELLRRMAQGTLALPVIKAAIAGRCEVAQRLAGQLGFQGNIVKALGQLYERWDGKGAPHGLKGEAVSPAVQVVTLAQDALLFYQLDGEEGAVAIARKRRGEAYSPPVVDAFCSRASELLAGINDAPTWETVLDLEPGHPHQFSPEVFNRACEVMADFVDIKSPYTLNHSGGVARLAAQAARMAGFQEADMQMIYQAGLLHDLGRTGVSSAIWEKVGPLSAREWEQVRLHPYYTERILMHSPALSRLGELAGKHHERLNGSGYHRGLTEEMLPPLARILAVADVFYSFMEARPHRGAFSPERAAQEVQSLARLGLLDGDAVQAVLLAGGLKSPKKRPEITARISQTEVDVLRLLVRGLSTRQIAEALAISTRSVNHTIHNMYTRIGVSTRAGATIFALQHHLIKDAGE